MIRLAVDAMGGDHAPSAIVDGAVAAARHLDVQISLVGVPSAIEEALSGHPDWRHLRLAIVDAPDVVDMTEAPAAALRRKPRASIRVAADLVARHDAAALFSAGHTGATVMAAHAAFGMIPGVDRPALATTIPTRATPGGAARRRRQRRMPAAASPAVRGHGRRVRTGRAGRRAPPRRPAVDRRRRNQGQRADARGASAAESRAAQLHRQRRRAGDLQRRRGRHRLRRLHRQRRAQDERRARRDRRGAARRRAAGHVLEPGRLPAVAPCVPAVPAPRRLFGVRRRAAARRRRPRHRRPRPLVREGGAQRHCHGLSLCDERLPSSRRAEIAGATVSHH